MWLLRGVTVKGFLLASILSIVIVALSFGVYILWMKKDMIEQKLDQALSDKDLVIEAASADNKVVQKAKDESIAIDKFLKGESDAITIGGD